MQIKGFALSPAFFRAPVCRPRATVLCHRARKPFNFNRFRCHRGATEGPVKA